MAQSGFPLLIDLNCRFPEKPASPMVIGNTLNCLSDDDYTESHDVINQEVTAERTSAILANDLLELNSNSATQGEKRKSAAFKSMSRLTEYSTPGMKDRFREKFADRSYVQGQVMMRFNYSIDG